MTPITLHGTPLSHFTRKVRVLLKELDVPFAFERPQSLLTADAVTYGDNPLLRVPTLVHDGETLLDSDHIARFLIQHYDARDRFGVLNTDPLELNRLAVANGIMANEVVLILAKRAGLEQLDEVVYFKKLGAAIRSGLRWLNEATPVVADSFRYADIATVCMWQHVVHYGLVPDLEPYANLAAHAERLAERPSIAQTTPAASLAEAARLDSSPA
jgi:glutathione S-transferase